MSGLLGERRAAPDTPEISRRWLRRTRRLAVMAAVAVTVAFVLPAAYASVLTGGSGGPTIQSDLADYNPGGTVTLTGSGWDTGGTAVHIVVNDDVGQTWQHVADVTPDSSGAITDVFTLPNYFVAQYSVQAIQITPSAELSASTSFTDANPSADLDQCGNDPAPSPSTDGCNTAATQWENGNLGASKSVYFEGDSVPYRMKFDNLSLASHKVTIEWDTTKSGTHALDYITTFNRTVANANPCLGVSGCGSPTTFPIPADPQVTGAGVTPAAGNFTLYGGTITGVSAYSYPDGTGFAGDKSAQITITFTANQANPVLAWGGHISRRQDWGANNSAVAISGSPYHTRLIDLDGSGGNQDRSLSADAVIFPGSITIVKDAVPNDPQDFSYSSTGGLTPSSFVLDDDADSTRSNTQAYSGITSFSTYTFTETTVAGWTLSFNNPVCTVTTPTGGTQSASNSTVTINLNEGENVTCTFINTRQNGTLIVKKLVVNDNGGTKAAGDFNLHVKTGVLDVAGSPAAGSATGTSYSLAGGSYTVSEDAPPTGYTQTGISGDCDSSGNVTVVAGQTKTCTITNNDIAPKLHLRKTVINNNGGTAPKTAWTLNADGTGSNDLSGVDPVDSPAGLQADTWTLSESNGPAGYAASDWSCSGGTQGTGADINKISVGLGEEATCTITNNDIAPSLTLNKIVVNDNGGTAAESAWTLTANGGGAGTLSGPGAAGNADVVSGSTFKAGTYALSESTGPAGYTGSAWSCVKNAGGAVTGSSITLALADTAVCTITNSDQPGTIIIQKNATPQNGTFTFTTTGTTSGPGTSWPSQFTLTGSTSGGGNVRTFTVDAGNYSVAEGLQLSWTLTGIGGVNDPNTPYNCIVTGSNGSTGVGDLNDRKVTISLKNGDTVKCIFENTGNGATRTQGFWATHERLARIAWPGGQGYGHTFPGVAAVMGDTSLCSRTLGVAQVMGGFWSDISKTSNGKKRTALDQARMQLLQQLLAAELNATAFGSLPTGGVATVNGWEAAFCGTSLDAIKNAQQGAASFNSQGDNSTFTPGTSANSKEARSVADTAFWDTLPAG